MNPFSKGHIHRWTRLACLLTLVTCLQAPITEICKCLVIGVLVFILTLSSPRHAFTCTSHSELLVSLPLPETVTWARAASCLRAVGHFLLLLGSQPPWVQVESASCSWHTWCETHVQSGGIHEGWQPHHSVSQCHKSLFLVIISPSCSDPRCVIDHMAMHLSFHLASCISPGINPSFLPHLRACSERRLFLSCTGQNSLCTNYSLFWKLHALYAETLSISLREANRDFLQSEFSSPL